MTIEEKEDWENVKYRMREEGIDYCFLSYSNFEEIKDPEFHSLRIAYIKAVKDIREYVNNKCNEEIDEDIED